MHFCVWTIAAIYILIGYITNKLYEDRDMFLSDKVGDLAYGYFDNGTAYLRMEEATESAGWFFWRRRKPFSVMPRVVNELIGLAIWPIDLLLSEAGYKRELRYLEDSRS
jgi:hypothetical protein